jgi:hypothetical protein
MLQALHEKGIKVDSSNSFRAFLDYYNITYDEKFPDRKKLKIYDILLIYGI